MIKNVFCLYVTSSNPMQSASVWLTEHAGIVDLSAKNPSPPEINICDTCINQEGSMALH